MAELKLPFGLKDDILVHVSQVPQGLACGCVCAHCRKPLIARKGPKVVHHFAHYKGAECAKALETALHLEAKRILADRREIRLPAVEIRLDYGPRVIPISPERTFALDDVRLECRTGDIVPDILAHCGTRPLMIEIRVTHPVDETKLSKIRELGVSTIEIDLSSACRDFSPEGLSNAIVEQTTNKHWLFNAKSWKAKRQLLKTGEKKAIGEGRFELHVAYCPIRAREYKGKPYVNFMDDCIYCDYLLDVGQENIYIICGGEHKIRTFEELRKFRGFCDS
jgi:hypothetical protein